MQLRRLIISLSGVVLLASCSVEKHLQPGESVLYANRVAIAMQDGSVVPNEVTQAAAQRNKYIIQTPNRKVLGLNRLPMHVYCLSSPTDSGWVNRTLRNIGQSPVIYDPQDAELSAKQLSIMMAQKGCFNTNVDVDTVSLIHRNITIQYTIKASTRFKIDDITFHCDNPEIPQLIKKSPSLLKVGDYYDQENIDGERVRIVNLLKEEGYFLANDNLIHFIIDTTYAPNQLSIDVEIRNPIVNNDGFAEERPLQKYFFHTISIDSNAVRESVIRRILNIMPGHTYSPSAVSNSYNSLLNLRNFNLIDIRLLESPRSNDAARLIDASIHLRNSLQQKISLSLELTNASPITKQSDGNFLTNGNFGIETILGYQHHNIFGGAELLNIEGSLLVELPKTIFNREGQDFHSTFSAFEIGAKTTLDLPIFLLPFSNYISQLHTKPHTIFSASTYYQYRSYFERLQLGGSFGYSWNVNNRSRHQLSPFDLTYVRIFNIDEDYIQRISEITNLRIAYQYSDHFIMGCRYDFIFNNQVFGTRHNFTYIHASAESAGNLLSLLSSTAETYNEDQIKYLFDVPFSQYLRFSIEAKRYLYHLERNTLVLRCLVGIGLPYGNSFAMPYEKSFFGGGPTTLRAWQIRRLGPGSFKSDLDFDFERTGDVNLVLNIEERFPIVGPFEGALFLDAGNVWVTNKNLGYTNGEFDLSRLPQDLALGAGLGVRLKISILTIRCDFAVPIHDPSNPKDAWIFRSWSPSRIVTNFGIDYPF